MQIIMELNKKFGRGYQMHLIHGPIDMAIDDEPFTIYEAAHLAQMGIDKVNKITGEDFKAWENMRITDEALQGNKSTDCASKAIAKDVETGAGKLVTPGRADREGGDREREVAVTGRGVVLCCLFTWIDEKNEKARLLLERYCNLLAMRGYGNGASKILAEALAMDKSAGALWVRDTYEKYIRNDAEVIQMVRK